MTVTETPSETAAAAPLSGHELASAESFGSRRAGGEEAERNPVFTSLVTDDSDVVGLIAYSIYKQNKHDWLLAFSRARGRDPDEGEVAAYIIGESTPRRMATYRHLAQATLEGKGPDVHVASSGMRGVVSATRAGQQAADRPLMRVLGYVVTAIVVFIAVALAIRFGILRGQ